mmetsp:Transcript_13773/g.39172  ORF Transcript_13773/g.39172 Transcript_13773/m.39172 type:complete len:236 (+) Transcript_13773:91-798(+)|eukprot:CAMPEP_0119133624 /NCGR_PEP_ID=MMETSP1310-20130426/13471_1 /TAXON_ID=464262 /ORGANISM="Genus nov. species nov., Strain RCC2339" /LENGTH=235 /DNA_ID=CAMNT_0007124323 /DNA_START=58 /DNA_END=765 /DNA_ORIENTATION=-
MSGVAGVPKLISPEVVKLAKKDVHLPEIVSDATLRQLFIDFLEKEMMHENFLFWLDVEEYTKVKDEGERKKTFEVIYDKFLKSNAEMEMCISGRRRVAIESKREKPTPDIFAAVQHDVWVALTTECVPRFCRSEIFLSYLMNKPDSPRTRFSRQKLQEFFGMEIEGLLYRVELIQIVQEPGYERSRRKRVKQKKMKHLAVLSDKFAEPTKQDAGPNFDFSAPSGGGAGPSRSERK